MVCKDENANGPVTVKLGRYLDRAAADKDVYSCPFCDALEASGDDLAEHLDTNHRVHIEMGRLSSFKVGLLSSYRNHFSG